MAIPLRSVRSCGASVWRPLKLNSLAHGGREESSTAGRATYASGSESRAEAPYRPEQQDRTVRDVCVSHFSHAPDGWLLLFISVVEESIRST